jgi:broad specificity phosphatase PhoE
VTTFYLVRHAEKNAPANVLTGRAAGVHLTEFGRRQAQAVAAQLARQPLQQIYSSPMIRAKETAEPLARSLGLPIEIAEAFNELDCGAWTNLSFDALDLDPRWHEFNSRRSTSPIPSGESMATAQSRFVGGMLRAAERFPDAHVAIFSHRDPILAAIFYFLGLTLDACDRCEINLAGISTLTLDGARAQLLSLNDISATRFLSSAVDGNPSEPFFEASRIR